MAEDDGYIDVEARRNTMAEDDGYMKAQYIPKLYAQIEDTACKGVMKKYTKDACPVDGSHTSPVSNKAKTCKQCVVYILIGLLYILSLVQFILIGLGISKGKDTVVSTTNRAIHCAEGWIQYQESCYLFWDKSELNFSDAAATCGRYGAHLVFVETEAENDFLKQKLRVLTDTYWWMGLTNLDKEGTWKYFGTNKVATFTNWAPGEPSNANEQEHCAHLWDAALNKNLWNNAECQMLFQAICETF